MLGTRALLRIMKKTTMKNTNTGKIIFDNLYYHTPIPTPQTALFIPARPTASHSLPLPTPWLIPERIKIFVHIGVS